MRENRTSGTVQGAPGNRRSYCETGLSPIYRFPAKLSLYRIFEYRNESADQVEGNEWSGQYGCRYQNTFTAEDFPVVIHKAALGLRYELASYHYIETHEKHL